MCGSEAETNGHALWWCDSAQAVWGNCEGPIQKSSVVAEDFFGIFSYLCARLEKEDLELFAVIANKIWSRRNKVVFGGSLLPPSILIKEATKLLGDFRKHFAITVELVNGGFSSHNRWLKPEINRIKINWDATLDGRKKIMGMGIVARDCLGVVKATMCADISYIRDPIVAEAIGARGAAQFGHEIGFSSIELEGDARENILTLGDHLNAESFYGNLVSETRQILESFRSWRVSHVR
jgi:hypothetical protein